VISTKHTHRCVVGFTVHERGIDIDYGSGEETIDWAVWDRLMAKIVASRATIVPEPPQAPKPKSKRSR
jgi:hypothetical protein